MKFWVVYPGYEHDTGRIGGIFSSKEKAEAYLAGEGFVKFRDSPSYWTGRTYDYAEIEEHILDEGY